MEDGLLIARAIDLVLCISRVTRRLPVDVVTEELE